MPTLSSPVRICHRIGHLICHRIGHRFGHLIGQLCLLVLGCACLSLPTAHAHEPHSVVVRDPVTGELRAPTAAELRALRPAPAPGTAGSPPPQHMVMTRPDGTRAITLGDDTMVYSVATRDAQGNLKRQCVTAGQAGAPALVTPSQSSKEHDHGQR